MNCHIATSARGLFALALIALGGCGAPDDSSPDSQESAFGSSLWQQTLVCNRGAAVLDVDQNDRRHVQFVIRDASAINYITGTIRQQMLLNRGDGRELIATGWGSPGVFDPGDFDSFSQDSSDYRNRIRVFRDGSGIKVVFERHERQGGFCTDWCSDFCCGGYAGATDVYPELANFYFDDCR